MHAHRDMARAAVDDEFDIGAVGGYAEAGRTAGAASRSPAWARSSTKATACGLPMFTLRAGQLCYRP
ncbi:hypothetical protein SANTM175S_04611 [Streptomyces antimycoticus]